MAQSILYSLLSTGVYVPTVLVVDMQCYGQVSHYIVGEAKQNYIIIFTYLPLVDYFILQNQLDQLQCHVSASKCDIYWMQWCYKAIVDSACHLLSQIGSRGVPEPTLQARWLYECHFLAKMQRDSSFLPNILLKSILLCVSEHLEEKMKKVFFKAVLRQIRLDQIRLDQIRLGQVRLGQVRLDQIRLDQVWCGVVWLQCALGLF